MGSGRYLIAAAVAVAGSSGCWTHGDAGADTAPYSLLAVDATIHPTNHDGNVWCPARTALEVSVTATLDGATSVSPDDAGLTPAWNAPLVSAPAEQYADGLFIDVRGHCDGPSFRIGAALLHPSSFAVERGGMQLIGIGNVDALRLFFAPDAVYGPGAYGTPADGVYDPYYVSDEGAYDDSGGYQDDSGDPTDSGGDCGCDGAYGGGDGSDGSGDGSDGSDSGGDGTESIRITRPGAHAHRSARGRQ